MRLPRPRSPRRDAGSIAVELTILLPAFLALAMLAWVFGTEVTSQNTVDLAARDAARAASISRTAADAGTNGRAAAASTLASACRGWNPARDVVIDTTGFAVRPGQAASVTVTVSCAVPVPAIALVGATDTTLHLSATFTSPLDVYRGRSA